MINPQTGIEFEFKHAFIFELSLSNADEFESYICLKVNTGRRVCRVVVAIKIYFDSAIVGAAVSRNQISIVTLML